MDLNALDASVCDPFFRIDGVAVGEFPVSDQYNGWVVLSHIQSDQAILS